MCGRGAAHAPTSRPPARPAIPTPHPPPRPRAPAQAQGHGAGALVQAAVVELEGGVVQVD